MANKIYRYELLGWWPYMKFIKEKNDDHWSLICGETTQLNCEVSIHNLAAPAKILAVDRTDYLR